MKLQDILQATGLDGIIGKNLIQNTIGDGAGFLATHRNIAPEKFDFFMINQIISVILRKNKPK